MEEYPATHMPQIGDTAPAFHAVTTQGEIDFPMDYNGKWVILFSYPSDFTPISTTEFMTFASMINEFKELKTELIGLSIDSVFSHIAFIRKIKELVWKDIKHVDVTFPIIEDISLEVAKMYGMLHAVNSGTQTVSAVFIIDQKGNIRAILYYPPKMGRNIEEIKRIIIALQKADCEKIVTPANWMPGNDVIVCAPGTCGAANDRMQRVNENMYCLDWFLSFKQSDAESELISEIMPEILPFPSADRNLAVFTKNNRD